MIYWIYGNEKGEIYMKKLSKFLTVVLATGTLAACSNGANDAADDTKVDEPAVEETVEDPAADDAMDNKADPTDDKTDADTEATEDGDWEENADDKQ